MNASGSPLFATPAGADWIPSEATVGRSRIAALMRTHDIDDVAQLHRHAVADPDWYWRAAVNDLGITFDTPFSAVRDDSDGPPFPRWFVDGTINVATNCVDRFAAGADGERAAIVWHAESGDSSTTSYAELHRDVVDFTKYLRDIGVVKGDRVGLFIPMIPAAAAAFLACARIGAVLVPAFSGYGPEALVTRLRACDVSVVITADGFRRKGGVVAMKPVVDRAVTACPSVHTVVTVAHLGLDGPTSARDISWYDALAAGRSSDAPGDAESLDPNHPLMIVYTSGTSGLPKGIVHSHGGFLVKAAQDFGYSLDVQRDDVVLWITDMGWLVGPLLIVGVLQFNATAVFYEGVPNHPNPGAVWDVVDRHAVTLLGISPTAVRGMASAGDEWVDGHQLGSLRGFASTGEPWNPSPWRWLFERIGGGRLPIFNYSGGTEVGGGILTCYPVLPIRAGAFSGPAIAMDVDVVDERGSSVRGELGELVVRNTWPGMTHSFWLDPDRYLESYWSQFPGVWVQGDLAVVDADGHWLIKGRSDDTIKIAGKRVGPAEIESALVAHPVVVEAATVGIPDELKGQVIVCFVVLDDGAAASAELARGLSDTVVDRLGRTLAPHRIEFVRELPKTRNGKTVRRAIRARYLGLPQGDLSSLDDLAALDAIPQMVVAP